MNADADGGGGGDDGDGGYIMASHDLDLDPGWTGKRGNTMTMEKEGRLLGSNGWGEVGGGRWWC